MKKRLIRRNGLLVAAMLCMGVILIPAKGINAAVKQKTIYIPTVLTNKYTDSDGEKTIITETREFTAQGLYMSRSISDKDGLYNRYTVIRRDRKGRVLKEKQYSDSGLDGTYTYTYWKNGRIKKIVYKPAKQSGVSKQTFNKKGFMTYHSVKSGKSVDINTYKYKFNKKGDPTFIETKWKRKAGSHKAKTRITTKITVKNSYIKKGKNKGKLSKQVSVARGSKFNTSSSVVTTTIKNKYNKKGRLVRTITTTKRKDTGGDSEKDKTVTTYRYQTVIVPKKYWKTCKYFADQTFFNKVEDEE